MKSTIAFRNGSTMTIVGDRIVGIDIVGDVSDETNKFLLKIEEDRHMGPIDGEQTLTQPDEEPAASHAHEPAPEPTESS